MDKKRIQKLKEKLLDLKEEILKVIQAQEEKTLSRDVVDEIDHATEMINEMMGSTLNSNQRTNLKMINEALKRIDQGEYGICQACSKEISLKRIEALPFAVYCVKCREQFENM